MISEIDHAKVSSGTPTNLTLPEPFASVNVSQSRLRSTLQGSGLEI